MSGSTRGQLPTRALILAAGVGSRLRPLTDRIPKCLVPIAGRPLLAYWIEALMRVGVREIWINTHAHAEQVRALIAEYNGRNSGVRLHECHEPELLGSAGTVSVNPQVADGAGDVIVVYADNFSVLDLRSMLAAHAANRAEFTMALFASPNPRSCGIAELDDQDRVVAFVEKPETPRGNLANAGIYVLAAEVYREIAALCAFDLGFDVIPRYVGRMHGFRHAGYHVDVGTQDTYRQACAAAEDLLTRMGQTPDGRRRAVFLDRDGTLIEHVHYLNDPAQVRLVEGCGSALRALRDAGFAIVVITNQAAIGKGLLDAATLERIHERMFELLASEGVTIDALYWCPEAGASRDRSIIEHPDRKPGPGMLLRGASELGLALERSYMVGDMLSDVLAGHNAGCRASLLVDGGAGVEAHEEPLARRFPTVSGVGGAARWILEDVSRIAGN